MDLESAIKMAQRIWVENPRRSADENEVTEKYGKIFSFQKIDELTEEDFKSFLVYKNNKHWIGLQRGSGLAKDMIKLKKTLKILLDERIPIQNRLKRIRDKSSSEHHEGFGVSYYTPILLVSQPEKYPVVNGIVKEALEVTNLYSISSKPEWEFYPEVCSLIIDLAKKHGLSLWQMDWVWWAILGVKTYDELKRFILNEMIMQENYQPVIIKLLLENGVAGRDEIRKSLIDENPELPDPDTAASTVIKVLNSHKIIRKGDEGYELNLSEDLADFQREELFSLCDEKIYESEKLSRTDHKKIVLFSVAGEAAFDHYRQTIISDIITSNLEGETSLKKLPRVRAWGALPNKWGYSKWNKLKQGDILLFYHDKKYVASAVLEGKEDNSKIAKQLWGQKSLENPETWELIMYMLPQNVKETEVDFLKLNELLGYQPNFMPTRTLDFSSVRQEIISNLVKKYGSVEKALESIGFQFGMVPERQTTVTYLLLRHSDSEESNRWKDELGKRYHFSKIANYTKLTKGSRTIWFDRKGGRYYFLGCGDVSDVIQDENGDFLAIFDKFESFVPQREANDFMQQKIMRSPGYNIQSSILEIDKEIYNQIVGITVIPEKKISTFNDEPLPIPTKDELDVGYKKISEELLIPEGKITEIVTALASGRHVLLAGPIGTGKTELARKIPEIFWEKYGGYHSEDHTATSDWNTQDVIGGIFPKMNKSGSPIYEIQNGCVVETVQKNWLNGTNGGPRRFSENPQKIPPYRGTWLIIDEFNRADIDKAFGQLFTALRTRTLKIPTDVEKISYKTLTIPQDYRIIGTLNIADKHYLFQLSDALKSRFAYIEIDIPKKEQLEQEIYYAMKNALADLVTNHYEDLVVLDNQVKKINKEQSNPEFYSRIYQAYHFLDTVRIFKRLGTAILKLVYQNLLVGTKMTENSKVALDNALTSNLIPQLENRSQSEIGAIHALYSDSIVKYFQDAYKNPNRQSYVDALTTVLEYLQVLNATQLVAQFANGNLNVEDTAIWRPLQTAYDTKKKEFELQLDQLKQSMEDLIQTMVI